MNAALDTSLGKPGTDLKVIYIGTLAPSTTGWLERSSVSRGWQRAVQPTFVMKLQGDLKRWDQWSRN